jgi:hypothetical protein
MRMVRSQRPIGLVEPEVHMLLRAAGQSRHGLAKRNYCVDPTDAPGWPTGRRSRSAIGRRRAHPRAFRDWADPPGQGAQMLPITFAPLCCLPTYVALDS